MQDDSGDGQPLALAAGKAVATLTNHGIVAVRKFHYAVVYEGSLGRLLYLLLCRIGIAVQQVVPKAGVEKVAVLCNVPDETGQGCQANVSHVRPIDADGALGNVVQARYQVRDRCLAGATGTHERSQLARLDFEVHPAQRHSMGGLFRDSVVTLMCRNRAVVQAHVIEGYSALHIPGFQNLGQFLINDLGLDVQVAENALEQGEGGLKLHRHSKQRAYGEVQAGLQRGKRNDCAGCDAGRRAAGQHVPGYNVNHHRGYGKEDLHDGEEGLASHLPAQRQVRKAKVALVEPANLLRLPAEELRQHHTRYGQCFLRYGRQVGGSLLGLGANGPALGANVLGQYGERRHRGHGHQSQLPRQYEHGDEGADEDNRIGQHIGHGARDDVLDAAHIVGHPRLDLSGPSVGEEAK